MLGTSAPDRTRRAMVIALAAFVITAVLGPAASASGGAVLSLRAWDGRIGQTSRTQWTLAKSGTVDEATSTVGWDITATRRVTPGGRLAIGGQLSMKNSGWSRATIGNIVVNLQRWSGSSWVTRSSDVADATHGDAATSAKVVPAGNSEHASSFTENPASGALTFLDAGGVYSLVPQKTIRPGTTKALRFLAEFDNGVLGLPTGRSIRVEILVTYGNAARSASSASNLDINGNGVIDPDEATVRTGAARLGFVVPAPTSGVAPTLSDTAGDISTTGTVSFSNAVFDLGATTGTVRVDYDAGADGGTITNCAHLRGPGVDLEACDTQTIDPPTGCTPGTPGCPWEQGDMYTYPQGDWGDDPASDPIAALLDQQFNNLYPTGLLEVGIPGAGGFSMVFDSNGVLAYLPAGGTPGVLTSNLFNPTSSSSGFFGGDIVALELNADFSAAGLLAGVTSLGNLNLCGVPGVPTNTSVSSFLAMANIVLGGGTGFVGTLSPVASELNVSFLAGSPSDWAQEHLVNGPCGPWEQGDMLTYPQGDWGDNPATNPAAALLDLRFNQVYPFGTLEVGISGTAGFSLTVDSNGALAYLPAAGAAGVLTTDLFNPITSPAGSFGGAIVALELNTDFSAAGFLPGVAPFGSLNICGVAGIPNLDVQAFLDLANVRLGGGSGPNLADLDLTAAYLYNAFTDGSPSDWAQEHLVDGPCPWEQGDMLTYPQGDWGDSPAVSPAAQLVDTVWDQAFAATSGTLEVGIPSTGGFSLFLTDGPSALAYLPASGAPGPLNADAINPTSSAAGSFGGDTVSLSLNVQFSSGGHLGGIAPFGDLSLCGITGLPEMNVDGFLDVANTWLGGGTSLLSLGEVATLTTTINASFVDGIPSTFAQEHLVNGPCP